MPRFNVLAGPEDGGANSMTEYRVVDSVGIGPVYASYKDAEETAQLWRDRALKRVRIEQREVGPWRTADAPPGP